MPQCTYWIQKSLDGCFASSHKQCRTLVCTLIRFSLDIENVNDDIMESLTMKIAAAVI